MRSRAALGAHPLHPAMVPLPIGAFFLALVADVTHAVTKNPLFYDVAAFAIGVGIVTALLAAVLGLVDYFGVKMSAAGRRLATIHLAINVVAVVLYVISWLMRRDHGALDTSRWPLAFGLAVVPFLMLGISGWIGGKMSYEHKIGVVEWLDPEATEIGRRETQK
ncbi:MAG TPA: DUF2231 domain-containing protein [Thermoanaerobaculia bacterium]|nr:DUF2231 domain-containing protein [Thermoanaerobaculia bacterium]